MEEKYTIKNLYTTTTKKWTSTFRQMFQSNLKQILFWIIYDLTKITKIIKFLSELLVLYGN